MAVTDPNDAQLLLVSAGDSDSEAPHLWIAATPRAHALKAVLRIVQPGSSARLLPQRLSFAELAKLNLRRRDIKDLGVAMIGDCSSALGSSQTTAANSTLQRAG